jgi:formylglycine-generating enzyme required for sulfatase activity
MARLIVFALAIISAVVGASPSGAQPQPARIALLIGNQAYSDQVGPLKNPHNDVALLDAALRQLGFAVTVLKDAGYRDMDTAIKRHIADVRRAGAGALSFFYYSGHGVANPETQINYLIPTDVRDANDPSLWHLSFEQNDIIEKLNRQAPQATHYVVFDACRNELRLTGAGQKALGAEKGFVPVAQTAGLLIAYATAPKQTASDVGDGGGPYARALAGEIVKPGVEAVTMFRNVQLKVKQSIGQDPWLSFPSLPEVYLAGRASAQPAVAAVTPAPPPLAATPALSEAAIAWERVRQSQSVAVLDAFTKQFPGTVYAAEATERIAEVRREADERQRVALLQKQEADRKRAEAEAAAKRKSDEEATARAKADADARARDEAARRDPALSVAPGSGQSFKDRLADGSECAFCPEMVVVPAGSFMMGSPESEAGRSNDEGPQRRVTIAKPFAVGKFEVTFAEWDACVSDGGCTHKPETSWGRGRQPVHSVSWDDITTEYLPWLSRKTGKTYRLLSEAEWEYAARAGTTTPFSFGATISTDQANYNGNVTYGTGRKGVNREKTIEVGSLNTPNAWGLHDMHGNVREWVEDCWHDNYSGAPTDGSTWTTACAEVPRVLRGGSWGNYPLYLRSAIRLRVQPGLHSIGMGFRLARTLHP